MSFGKRGRDAHDLLVRALQERAGGGDAVSLAGASSQAWASATFCGARHQVALRFIGDSARGLAERLAGEMDAIEFRLPGHLVADIAVTAREDTPDGVSLEIEALTVEDA